MAFSSYLTLRSSQLAALNSVNFTGSTITAGSTINTTTLFYSTMLGSTITVSTLSGSTFSGSTIAASSITANRLVLSTLTGSTITVSTLIGSTLSGSTMVISSIIASGLVLSTITVSSINNAVPGTGAGVSAFSTLTVSSIVSVSSIQTTSTMYTSSMITTGSVGIGTATPSAQLHISNASMNRLTGLYIGPSTQSGIVLDSTSGTNGKSFNIWSTASGDSAAAGSLVFFDITSSVYRMVINPSGQVGIGTTTLSDSFVVNSGSIVINNSAAASAGYLFNQNSVWGGMDIEGITNTGAQTINVGVNTNRAKAWSSSYNGLWLRIDTRTGYNGFHFFNKAVTSGIESEIMTILSNGNVGIGSVNPTQTLDVAGTIARSGMKLPRVDYGTLGTAGSITIPILFSDTQYNMVEIRVRYVVIHTAGVNINISATSTQPAALNFIECGLTTIQYLYPTAPINSFVQSNTTSLLFASGVEQIGIEHNLLFRMTRTLGTNGYLRNHYSYDNVYTWTGIGTAQGTGRGHIDTTSMSYPIASITLTPSAGTINCVYNTTHYN